MIDVTTSLDLEALQLYVEKADTAAALGNAPNPRQSHHETPKSHSPFFSLQYRQGMVGVICTMDCRSSFAKHRLVRKVEFIIMNQRLGGIPAVW